MQRTLPNTLLSTAWVVVSLLTTASNTQAQPVGSNRQVHVVEFEALASSAAVSSGAAIVQPMSGFGSNWGGDAQLFWRPPGPGNSLSIQFDAPAAGLYDLTLFYTVAPDFGDFSVRVRNSAAADVRGYGQGVALQSTPLGRHMLDASGNQLVFTVGGKETNSLGYIVGLDRIELAPAGSEAGGIETTLPPATRVAIPGLKLPPATGAPHPLDEFIAIHDGKMRVGYATPEGQLVVSEEQPVPGFLYYAGNFDGKPGDELLTYDPPSGDHFLVRFDGMGLASEPEQVGDSVPMDLEKPFYNTVGRFADSTSSCLFRWEELRGFFAIKEIIDGFCFDASGVMPFKSLPIPVDVTGDGRDEVVFIDRDGVIDIVVLGSPRPSQTINKDGTKKKTPDLGFSMERATDRWSLNMGLAYGDLDGNGAAELLPVVAASGDVWRLMFDSAGRVTDRRVVATDWPPDRVLHWPHDSDGDGADELLARDTASGQLWQVRWNPDQGRLQLTELEGIAPSFAYPGSFLGNGRDSLLLQDVVPGQGGRLGLLGFNAEGQVESYISDSRLVIPELATIVVGNFVAD